MTAADRLAKALRVERRPIPGWPGYFADSNGCIYSHKQRGRENTPLVSRPTHRGYRRVVLFRDGRKFWRTVHGLVLVTFVGFRPSEAHEARHLDGNKANNALWNLIWGTHTENEADKLRHGTRSIGERHGMAKLTEAQVVLIRQKRTEGARTDELAAAFGVSQTAIVRAISGRRWGHVT